MNGMYINESTFNRLVIIALEVTNDDDEEETVKEKIRMVIEDIAKSAKVDSAESLIEKVSAEVKRRRRLGLAPRRNRQ